MLTKDSDQSYLMTLLELLEENGIPATIQGTETSRMIIPRSLSEPTLWIYLDDQFEDAAKLILEPNHKVTTGINIEEFYSNQLSEENKNTQLNMLLWNSALYVILILLMMFVFLKVVG